MQRLEPKEKVGLVVVITGNGKGKTSSAMGMALRAVGHTMHLILTGRDAHPDIIERAHTVSEVREIKHAYRQKIEPQKGIDY